MKRLTLLARTLIAIVVALPAGGARAAPPQYTLSVSLNVRLDLTKLSPLATTGKLDCYARANTRQTITTAIAYTMQSKTPDDFNKYLAYPASYWSSHVAVTFPIKDGAYQGTQSVSINVVPGALTDPATHALWADPAVMAGCLISINGQVASRHDGLQLPREDNVAYISTGIPFFVLASGIQY